MTLALAERRRIPRELLTPRAWLSETLFELSSSRHRELQWPNGEYRDDPVRFAREILGIDLWAKQREIIDSVRDHPLTTVKSGHRIGKSIVGASAGLWFYSTFPDARVVMTAPTARQVEGILYRDTRRLFERSGRCLDCKLQDPSGPRPCPHSAPLDGELGAKAVTGLVSSNFRELKGYTAKDVEAITGTAGANLLFILDEASGVADAIYEGLEGNRAGWAEEEGVMVRMLMLGNPTKTSGEFYDSHEHPKKSKVYNRITVSSRETPNAIEGRIVYPGLATSQWIEQMEAKYGKDSAFIKVRVDGVFPVGEDGKAFPIDLIQRSQERWHDADTVGPLYIGIDPAGETGTGDETAMSARRGYKQLALRVFLGLTPEAHGIHLLSLIDELRTDPRERVIVVLDAEGPVGKRVFQYLSVLATRRNAPFELHRVRASDYAVRDPSRFDRIRDELAWSLAAWMRLGGAILEDELLEKELHVLEWDHVGKPIRSKITPKPKIRKELGRSPDRYDATALSTWEPVSASGGTGHDHDGPQVDDLADIDDVHGIDPYRGGGFDPYGDQ